MRNNPENKSAVTEAVTDLAPFLVKHVQTLRASGIDLGHIVQFVIPNTIKFTKERISRTVRPPSKNG